MIRSRRSNSTIFGQFINQLKKNITTFITYNVIIAQENDKYDNISSENMLPDIQQILDKLVIFSETTIQHGPHNRVNEHARIGAPLAVVPSYNLMIN